MGMIGGLIDAGVIEKLRASSSPSHEWQRPPVSSPEAVCPARTAVVARDRRARTVGDRG